MHRERPASEVGEVLADQVQVGDQLVDVSLAFAPVATTRLADHQHDPGRAGQDRCQPGQDRGEVHSHLEDDDQQQDDGGDQRAEDDVTPSRHQTGFFGVRLYRLYGESSEAPVP